MCGHAESRLSAWDKASPKGANVVLGTGIQENLMTLCEYNYENLLHRLFKELLFNDCVNFEKCKVAFGL